MALTGGTAIAKEVITIVGKPIVDECSAELGGDYESVFDSDDNFIGCTCSMGIGGVCTDDDGLDFLGPWQPPGGGGGGGSGGDDDEEEPEPEEEDECADDDAVCTCEEDIPEEEAESCQVSCGVCTAEQDDCLADALGNRDSCDEHNERKAHFLCSDHLRNYETVDDCVKGSINGFPGISSTDTNGSNSGWSINAGGKILWGISVGGSYGRGNNSSGATRITYPPIPVNRRLYVDCQQSAGDDFDDCEDNLLGCNNNVEDTLGEVCEESGDSAPKDDSE